jgi:hypothetical protein
MRVVESDEKGESRGTRRLQAFRSFLLQLLGQARRVSPRPYEVQQASRGCFGDEAANQLVHHLAGFGKEISFERIGELVPDGGQVWQVRTAEPGPEGRFISRSCNSTRTQYRLLPRPPLPPDLDGERDSFGLEPSLEFRTRTRKKALALALLKEQRRRVMPFRGSLEGGVHARRTLRSLLTTTPGVYVKERYSRSSSSDYSKEPVVWILDPVVRSSDGFRLECLTVPEKLPNGEDNRTEHGRITMTSSYLGPKNAFFKAEDGSFSIFQRQCLGFVRLVDADDFSDVKKVFGLQFESRVLRHDRMSSGYSIGCVAHEFSADAKNDRPWWEIVMLTALLVASEAVVCVVPDAFRLPENVAFEARARNKRLVFARLTSFTRPERDRLGINYSVELPINSYEKEPKEWSKRVHTVATKLGIEC